MVNTIIYFFPAKGDTLKATETLEVLKAAELEFEPAYALLQPSEDANGHLVDGTGKLFTVAASAIFGAFGELLERSRNIKISNDLLSIEYAINDPNSNIAIRWSRKWFHFLDAGTQKSYLQMLLQFARFSNSSYVLFVEDLFDMYEDRFEDRFVFANGSRFLDDSPKMRSKWDFMIDQIWIRNNLQLNLKSKRELILVETLGAGFDSYRIN